MQLAPLPALQLAYDVAGAAGSPVLLIMGFCVPGRAWRLQTPALASQHRVAWFDNRGVGGSGSPEGPWSMTDMAADALALLDHLGWQRAHVVGVSMGGMIAQHLALRAPERLHSLSLIATHAGGLRALLPTAAGARRFLATSVGTPKQRLDQLQKLLFPADFLATCERDWLRQVMLNDFGQPVPMASRRRQFAAIRGHRSDDQLHQLKAMPTLLVRPGQDQLIQPQQSDRLARLLPHARVLRFDQAGHGVIRQCADALNRELLGWFAQAEAAGAPPLKTASASSRP